MLSKAIDILYSAKKDGIEIILDNDQLQLKFLKDQKVSKELLEEIKNNKNSIIDFLKDRNDKSKNGYKIKILDRESVPHLPLSFSQERLWFIDQLEGSVQYHVPLVLQVRGGINELFLQYALRGVMDRHEILRTQIYKHEGEGFQRVKESSEWQLGSVEGSHYQQDSEGLQRHIDSFINEPFDLTKDYMLRANLISLSEDKHILVIVLHHIASDGWSMSLFVRELSELYASYVENRPSALQPLPLQYADYALWQRQYLQGGVLEEKLSYWKEKLQGVAPLQLPTDYPRPVVQSKEGALITFKIEKQLTDEIKQLGKQQGATLFMTLLAAFKVLLYRYTGQQDICVGTPTAGRQQQEVEGLIGFFVNTLALRSQLKGSMRFTEVLQQVRATTLEGYEHQEVPFEKIVEAVVKQRDTSRNPLFQAMLVLQNTPDIPQLSFGGIEVSHKEFSHSTAKFDLTLGLVETPSGLQGAIEYSTALFREDTIVRLIGHYQTLLGSLLTTSEQCIGQLPMLNSAEQQQLLDEFNQTSTPYPHHKSIGALFEEQVAKTPDAIALIFEETQLSYRQLNARANQVAHYLHDKGVKPGTRVPICLDRSLELIIGILGILKAGGAYVPIDPNYPSERINYMLSDTDATVILSDRKNHFHLSLQTSLPLTVLEDIEVQAPWEENLPDLALADTLAYVIYTSGSTGKPKGVMVEHKNVVSLVKGVKYVNLDRSQVLLSTGSPSFDATTFEYWSMLLNGGQLVLCSENTLLDSAALKKEITEKEVTMMWCTSSWFNSLVDTAINVFENVCTILVGGEKLSEKHIAKIKQTYPSVKLINGYGPTENTTFSLTHLITEGLTPIPIGRPLSNRTAYIVDADFQLVPIGVVGEICVGGDGLAKGYLNNTELTEQKFVVHAFDEEHRVRVYRTGDLGRWLPDGSIEYIGRKDDQVKIRGYRIELGEIESVLLQSGMLSQVVVMVKEDQDNNKQLVAYIVSEQGFNQQHILSYLKAKLPDYMIPSKWVVLDALPLTANGKVDKKALPEPNLQDNNESYQAPQSEAEKIMADIWKELLHLEQVGVKDNFFELGGHSLVILQLVERVRKMGVEINAKDFFAYQTIEQQSKFINTSLKLLETASEGKFIMAIQTKGDNIPVFAFPEFVLYSKIGNHISEQQPFYTIEQSPFKKEEEIISHYLSEIKKIKPHGPYCIMGYCRWGNIAVEIAQTLIDEGEDVPVLVLIEYYSSKALIPRSSKAFIGPKTKFLYDNLRKNLPYTSKGKFLLKESFYVFRFFYKKLLNFFKKSKAPVIKTYSGKVVLIRASETYGVKDDPYMGWSDRFTGDVESFKINGEHLGIFLEPGAFHIAEKLNLVLTRESKKYKLDKEVNS